MKKIVLVTTAFVLALGCTATPGGTAPAAAPAPAAAAPVQSQFKNLQVFPKDIPREQLLNAMKSFTRALGVRCNYCHVVTATEPKEQFDFPADTKAAKQMARVMLRMNMEINNTWIPRVQAAEAAAEGAAHEVNPEDAEVRVSCWTCHRGKTEPETPPPPPQEAPKPGA
jgi:hypothetical protein